MERGFVRLNVAVLAIGDALTIADEPPAQLVVDRFLGAGHQVVAHVVVGDVLQAIRARLLEWIADPAIDVVVATAGTRTEHAANALAPLVTKPLVGFSDLFRSMTFEEIGTAAVLVDVDAAQCKSTFVFLLPSSIGAVRTALDRLIIPQLDYRTKPANLVMRMPRVAHADGSGPAPAPEPDPWITPKKPTTQIAAVPAPPRPPPRGATTAPRVPDRSVSNKLEAVPQFTAKETTNVGAAPAPTATRPQMSTLPAPLPTRLPAAPAPMIEELEATPPRTREFEVVEMTGPTPKAPSASVMVDASLSQPITVATPAVTVDTSRAIDDRAYDDAVYYPPARVSRKFLLAWLGIALVGASMVTVFLVIRNHDQDANAAAVDPPGDRVAARLPQQPEDRAEVRPDMRPDPPRPPIVDDEIDMPVDPDPVPAVAPKPPKQLVVAKLPKQPRAPVVAKPPREPKSPRDPDEPALKPVTADNGCDEVSCALDRYQQACCAKYKPAEEGDLPEKIDRAMIVEGVGKMKPAVVRCGEAYVGKGTVKLVVQVGADGKVGGVTVSSTPDETLGICVATAIKKASFAKTQNGGSFGYPFVF